MSASKPVPVIAPSERSFRDWCWEQGLARGEVVYVDHPERLQQYRGEVVIVDLIWCGGYPWEAALRAVQMERDGLIAIRAGQTEAGQGELHRLVGTAAEKSRKRTAQEAGQ